MPKDVENEDAGPIIPVPKSIRFKEHCLDVAFNPGNDLIATSLITGHVFLVDGEDLYTASKDKSWKVLDLETGKEKYHEQEAHNKAVNIIKPVNEQIIATGDDDGCVKLWDIRQNKQAFEYKEHVDFISDMAFNDQKRHLLATSGDGCLSVYDVRKSKPFDVSDNQDDELLSVALMMNGKKVITGTQGGVLGIFSYGMFGDVTDRFPGHPQSIDTICKLSEDMMVTGSSDGILRIIRIFPNKLLGVAGEHGEFPIEKVVLSWDQNYLASCSHDNTVKFWDIAYMFNEEEEDGEEGDDNKNSDKGEDEDGGNDDDSEDLDAIISEFKQRDAIELQNKQKGKDKDDSEGDNEGKPDQTKEQQQQQQLKRSSENDETKDQDDSEDDSDDGDDSGAEESKKKKKRKKHQERNKVKNAKKQQNNKFFSDL
ncbi:hypothetical protein H4219_003863 [Mycoemilia scoparia]|uniref:WD repeat-containing protein JIP5 n=1 Tax=Mycoemilia scoparia TaxID=417184 RepID=A0A9W8DSR7_9FUNG|nr:hypothetical protein H4219_003863 [Mycoemilia scoparia]